MMLSCCDNAIFLVLSSCLLSMYCFDCLYDASFWQFEVYTHHRFLKFLVEKNSGAHGVRHGVLVISLNNRF